MQQSPVHSGTDPQILSGDPSSAASTRPLPWNPQQLTASAAATADASYRLQTWVGRLNTSRVPGVTRNSGWQAVDAELSRSRTRSQP